ncbi:nuclear transport factor 2 family protein [Carboxylicivirga marina]|uniref:Nuclear transport factor 2 family protein n=1 Tax=Carboxylicivirga marina TaxID=2800988 RepID=A0ABS1HP26_9BACT|nr:nuclear transport factor 2 family protein [Carboxylicivirga marina]MBK3519419.1 nuclear transport factor 2 family protein [Carboxylicivirga marina]
MKALLFSTMLIFCMITACNTDNSTEQNNLALIEKYVNAVENLDHTTMENLLHDDYLGLGPSYGDSIRKKEAVENWQVLVSNLYESIKYHRSRNATVKINDGENKGDWVSNWAELTIKYKHTDETATIWANSIYLIKDNKIIKSYTFYNEADAYRQLGFTYTEIND